MGTKEWEQVERKWEQEPQSGDKNGNKVGTNTRTPKWDKMGTKWEQSERYGNKVGTRTPKWDKNGNQRPRRGVFDHMSQQCVLTRSSVVFN